MSVVDHLLGEAPPLVGYRFAAVLFPGMVPMLAPVDMRFQSIDGLSATRQLDPNGNPKLVKPKNQRGTLSLKRGMPVQPTPIQVIHLLEQALWDQKVLRTDILVATLDDPLPVPTNAWLVTNAYLQSLSWGALDAESNKVLVETMTYSYERVISVPIPVVW